jgi:hypothetical protein
MSNNTATYSHSNNFIRFNNLLIPVKNIKYIEIVDKNINIFLTNHITFVRSYDSEFIANGVMSDLEKTLNNIN